MTTNNVQFNQDIPSIHQLNHVNVKRNAWSEHRRFEI